MRDGDVVLYDKGCSSRMFDLAREKGARIVTPSFVTNHYLSVNECVHSGGVSRARVIIENINERFKRFRMLQHTVPSALFPIIDEIVFVCAFLTTFMGPVRATPCPANPGPGAAPACPEPVTPIVASSFGPGEPVTPMVASSFGPGGPPIVVEATGMLLDGDASDEADLENFVADSDAFDSESEPRRRLVDLHIGSGDDSD